MDGSCPLRPGNVAISRIAHPSSVARRYEARGTWRRSSRPRRAATPALVCVRTRIGFGPLCRVRARAMRWVLPHPAGAETDPRSIASRSISPGVTPSTRQFPEVRPGRVGAARERPGPTMSKPTSSIQDTNLNQPDLDRAAFARTGRPGSARRAARSARRCFPDEADVMFASMISSPWISIARSRSRAASSGVEIAEQRVLDRPSRAPGRHLSRPSASKSASTAASGLHVVVAEGHRPVAELRERLPPHDRRPC